MKNFSRHIVARAYFPNDFQFSIRETLCPVSKIQIMVNTTRQGNFIENPSMRAVAKIFRARASEHSSNFCEQFEQRQNFANTFKLNGTIRYPLFRYRIYHPKQSLTILSWFSFSCSSTSYLAFHSYYTNSSSAKKSFPSSLEILQIVPKAPSSDFKLSCRSARSKFVSESFKSKLNSNSSDEK